ncbi:MAG: hypothetical protein KDD64_01730 [Bdellovibrionales bacterium]|nr:hypothetical protein [Bdellovibrionales bacterium]
MKQKHFAILWSLSLAILASSAWADTQTHKMRATLSGGSQEIALPAPRANGQLSKVTLEILPDSRSTVDAAVLNLSNETQVGCFQGALSSTLQIQIADTTVQLHQIAHPQRIEIAGAIEPFHYVERSKTVYFNSDTGEVSSALASDLETLRTKALSGNGNSLIVKTGEKLGLNHKALSGVPGAEFCYGLPLSEQSEVELAVTYTYATKKKSASNSIAATQQPTFEKAVSKRSSLIGTATH